MSMISEQAKDLRETARHCDTNAGKALLEAADTIETLSAKLSGVNLGELVEVVRCKDCKESEESLVNGCVYCNKMERAISDDGYCHYAERRKERAMTKTEATEWMKDIKAYLTSGDPVWDIDIMEQVCNMAIEALEGQKTGKWIDWLGTGNEWECSECRCSIESHGGIAYNYCPICGAKMNGADDVID